MKNSELSEIIREFITPRLIEVKELFSSNRDDFKGIRKQTDSGNAELKEIRLAIEKCNAKTEKNTGEINELKTALERACEQLDSIRRFCENTPNFKEVFIRLDEACEKNKSDLQEAVENVNEKLKGFKDEIKEFRRSIEKNNSQTEVNSNSIMELKENFNKYSEQIESLDINKKLDNTVSGLENVSLNLNKTIEENNFELQKAVDKIVSRVSEDKEFLNNTAKQLTKLSEVMDKNRGELQGYLEKVAGELNDKINELKDGYLKLSETSEKDRSYLKDAIENLGSKVSEITANDAHVF